MSEPDTLFDTYQRLISTPEGLEQVIAVHERAIAAGWRLRRYKLAQPTAIRANIAILRHLRARRRT